MIVGVKGSICEELLPCTQPGISTQYSLLPSLIEAVLLIDWRFGTPSHSARSKRTTQESASRKVVAIRRRIERQLCGAEVCGTIRSPTSWPRWQGAVSYEEVSRCGAGGARYADLNTPL